MRTLLVLPPKGAIGPRAFLCPLIHGWHAHVCPCEVEAFEHGRLVYPRHPVSFYSATLLFAEYYEMRQLALPYYAWGVETNQTLGERDHIANLSVKEVKRRVKKPALLAICDGDVGPMDEDEEGNASDASVETRDSHELAEDKKDLSPPLNEDTGTCEPAGPTPEEAKLLETPEVKALVIEKLEGMPPEEDPDAKLDAVLAALDEVTENGIPPPRKKEDSWTFANLQRAFNVWFDGYMEGGAAARARSTHAGIAVPPASGNASLLVREAGTSLVTSFIHWPTPSGKAKPLLPRTGRVVNTEDGKLVAIVPATSPLINFKSKVCPDGEAFYVLLADIGVKMRMVPKKDRPDIPAVAIRLRQMADVAISRKRDPATDGPGSPRSSAGVAPDLMRCATSPCHVCGLDDSEVCMCALCLCSQHDVCARRFQEWAAIHGEAARWHDAPRTTLLMLFQHTLCSACVRTDAITFET